MGGHADFISFYDISRQERILTAAGSLRILAASAMLAQQGNAADEQLVRNLLSDFATARNALDARKLASTSAEDGRAARTIHSVWFIDAGIAVADVDVNITGIPTAGLARTPKLMDICVLSKKSGEWKIAEAWTVSTQD